MTRLLRLIKIAHTIGKYRLIEWLPHKTPFFLRFLLAPLYCYPVKKRSRAEKLKLALEELGPIFVKFGQILSTRPDLFPADVIIELSKLQDNVTPFNEHEFKKIVEESLGQEVTHLFKSYDQKALASASIAQVHAIELHDGSNAIIKVVRPNIEKIIAKDIALLELIAKWVERYLSFGKRIRAIEVVRDYKDTINDELDLMREAANASQLKRNFEESKLLYIPKIYWEYTRKNVLVMERINGIPVNDIHRLEQQNTNFKLLAERGVEIFFSQVFDHNFFHADMHPGNVFVSKKNPSAPSYIAIDMAIVGSLNKEDQYYLARNMIAMFRRDYRQVAELHVLSGWVPKNTSINSFESAIRSVCEPIFQKPLKEISFGEALISLFQTAQRFEMPVQPQLVLLQKTLLNIEGLGRQLYPDLDLWETAHPFLEDWLKRRYHPKNLFKEIQYESTDWLEKLPQLPSLAINSLEQIKHLSELAPELLITQKKFEQSKRSYFLMRKYTAYALLTLSISAWTFLPQSINLSNLNLSLILGILGVILLLK